MSEQSQGRPEIRVQAAVGGWPHPWPKDPPDDAEVLDLLLTWAPDAAIRERVLVSNPAALYGF